MSYDDPEPIGNSVLLREFETLWDEVIDLPVVGHDVGDLRECHVKLGDVLALLEKRGA